MMTIRVVEGIVLLLLLFGFLQVAEGAGLVFTDDGFFSDYHSELCVPFNLNTVGSNYSVYGAELVFADADICTGRRELLDAKYKDKVVLTTHLHECSKEEATTAGVTSRVFDIGVHAKVKAIVYLWDMSNAIYAVPSSGYYLSASTSVNKSVPFITCSYLRNKTSGVPLEVNYVANLLEPTLMAEMNSSKRKMYVDLTLSPNPWKAIYDSVLYQIYFRGIGLVFLFTSFQASQYYVYQRRKQRLIASLLCLLEAIALFVLGLHITIGGWNSEKAYPMGLHMAFSPLFVGISFSTSLLAGLYFDDMRRSASRLRETNAATFLKRRRFAIIGIAMSTAFLDIVVVALRVSTS